MPTPPLLPQPPDRCPWAACGQPAPVEVLLTGLATPPHTYAAGCWCLGHAVIAGIQAQARHGGGLWYRPAAATRPRHPIRVSGP